MSRFYSETEVVASVEGLSITRLQAYVASDCVMPCRREGMLVFTEADLARLRLLTELAADFDLDEEAAGLVLGLVDQIHGLRHELRAMGEALAEEPGEVRARILARLEAGR